MCEMVKSKKVKTLKSWAFNNRCITLRTDGVAGKSLPSIPLLVQTVYIGSGGIQ